MIIYIDDSYNLTALQYNTVSYSQVGSDSLERGRGCEPRRVMNFSDESPKTLLRVSREGTSMGRRKR